MDVIDRVLDKGIVIDAWARVSVGGVDLITVESRVIVASIETYLQFVEWSRNLFIVATDQPDLLTSLRRHRFATSANVVLDRRRRQRRRKAGDYVQNRRETERRLRDINLELESNGMAVVPV